MAQMRGVFPLPFTSPQVTGTPAEITLPSGGQWYPPPGNYLITTGSQTIVQWWDPNGAIWRQYSGPETMAQIATDGTNYRLLNNSGTCVGASITNAGSGGVNGIGPIQTGSTVTFAAPAAGGVTATAQGYVVVGGTVPAPTVTQGGSGFLVPPTIVCDPPPVGGVQATFTSTISAAGVITGVTQQNPGAGYTSIPQFYIIPQPQFYQGAIRFPGDTAQAVPAPGLINPANAWTASPYQANIVPGTAGALLTGVALTGSGTLTAIVMTFFGSGYAGNTVPAISFGGTSLGAAAATAIMSFCLTAAQGGTVTATGGAAQIANTPSITSLGMIAGANNNNTFFPRPGRGLNNGATGSFAMEDPGYGLQGGAVFVNAGTSTTVATVTNTQYGGRVDTSVVQAMVQ